MRKLVIPEIKNNIYYSFAIWENVIEGAIQYIQDRAETFDDYFHVERKELQNKNIFPISLIIYWYS